MCSDEDRNDRLKRRGRGVLDNNKKNREETGLQKNSQVVVANEAEGEEWGSKREGAANSISLQSARLGCCSEKAATRRFSGSLSGRGRSAVWKKRRRPGGERGVWCAYEIKKKKKEERQKRPGDDVPSLCNQQPPIVWRPSATIPAQHCLPFRATTAQQQCLTIMHSLLRRQIIRS